MKKLTDQLQSVSKFLVNLSKQVEKISDQIDKHQSSKVKPAQTKKDSAAKAPKAKKINGEIIVPNPKIKL